ncbi:unnamed protein product [Mycena citricolor]|uniref:Glycosyl transferase CAP10 domain-containing protein n=1 Tax=Mycena citricolor TaxID=2018698 RepID=A0AAD2HXX0_9AGAR|nr:unnamed protein product [Mycena citricolor]
MDDTGIFSLSTPLMIYFFLRSRRFHLVLLVLHAAGLASWLFLPTVRKAPMIEVALVDEHTIDTLSHPTPSEFAQMKLDELLSRQSTTLAQAEARYVLKSGRSTPTGFDKWFEFARENECLIDEYEQIYRDFEPFYQLAQEHPSHFQRMIDKGRYMLLEEMKGLRTKQQAAVGMAAINITNGKLQMPPYQATTYSFDLPMRLRSFTHLLPDMEFLLNGRDEPRVLFNYRGHGSQQTAAEIKDATPFHNAPRPTAKFFKHQSGCNISSTAPGFLKDESDNISFLQSSSSTDFTTDFWPLLSMTKLSPCFSDILYPSPYHYVASRWSMRIAEDNVPWAEKKQQLFWRGSSNGGHIFADNYHSFPRFHLIQLARNHSELIDARMTTFDGGHCTEGCDRERVIAEYNITGKYEDLRELVLNYKYLLDISGNTFSGRFLALLGSGSLVFKSNVFEEYFDGWIRPNEHYIPVKPDLSDLVEKVEWAKAHDDEARRIQETGKLFRQRVVTDAQNDCYFAAVLLEWARLQSYTNGTLTSSMVF